MEHTDRLLVAVIDDDNAVRTSVGFLLASSGWRTAIYPGSRTFMEALAGGARPGHVMLLDLHMPDMNGVELLLAVRRLGIRVPAVVLSADPQGELARRALLAGAHTVLGKPFDSELLLRTLAQASGRLPRTGGTGNP